jgi:lysyl-tRNA synthetase class 2
MASIEELRRERQEKRDQLIAAGIDPYPTSSMRTHSISGVLDDFAAVSDQKADIWLAGRIIAIREHGELIFFFIFDG